MDLDEAARQADSIADVVLASLSQLRNGQTLTGLGSLAAARMYLDGMIFDVVREARTAGASWAAVGQSLGVSKQAAQQRYASRL